MKRGLEHSRATALGPATWRRVVKSRTGRRVFKSRPFQAVGTARRYAEASIRAASAPTAFSSVRTFCMFLGMVKSGGTLVGALLDAHPKVILADEADPLRYVAAGFSRNQIFHILAKAARREARKGRVTARRLDAYSLAVPGQWQGRWSEPAVVGDSRAGPTTRRLGEHPELIGQLRDLLGDVEDRYVNVIRNPYDPIAATVVRGRRTLSNAIDDYEGQCRRLAVLRCELGPKVLTVRYENLMAAPETQLAQVCAFLGLEPDASYLSACARIIEPGRPGERDQVTWQPSAIARVEQIIQQFSFLDGYSHDQEGRQGA